MIANFDIYGNPREEDVSEIELTPAEYVKYKQMAKEKLNFGKGFCGQKNQHERIPQADLNRMYAAIDKMEQLGEI